MAAVRRMRVFAGPNGSGKSTMKAQVALAQVQARHIDLGVYVNPDEIELVLVRAGKLDFADYGVMTDAAALSSFVLGSGILENARERSWFKQAWTLKGNVFLLRSGKDAKPMAQLLALHLYPLLLQSGTKFSFETVFSHPSKLDLMEEAASLGYKVYLYYVATESADINVDRVRDRVLKGGHHVPEPTVRSRYARSLQLLPRALDHCYHAFLFDNSEQRSGPHTGPRLFAEMKRTSSGVAWYWDTKRMPNWFIQHFLLASDDPQFIAVAHQAAQERGS